MSWLDKSSQPHWHVTGMMDRIRGFILKRPNFSGWWVYHGMHICIGFKPCSMSLVCLWHLRRKHREWMWMVDQSWIRIRHQQSFRMNLSCSTCCSLSCRLTWILLNEMLASDVFCAAVNFVYNWIMALDFLEMQAYALRKSQALPVLKSSS